MSARQAEKSKDQLYQEFNTVVTETEQLLKSLAAASGNKAGAMRDGVVDGFAAASEKLDKLRQQAMDQASAAAEATDDYVRENPWRAIGITAAVSAMAGLVIGLVMARK